MTIEVNAQQAPCPRQRSVVSHLSTSTGADDDYFELKQPGGNAIVVNTAALVAELLIYQAGSFSKGPVQEGMFRHLLGRSVSMVEGTEHVRLRRLLGPLFTRHAVRKTLPSVIATLRSHSQHWNDGREIDLYRELAQLTIHSIGATLIDEPACWQPGPFDHARIRVWQRMNDLASRDIAVNQPLAQEQALQIDSDVNALRSHVVSALVERLQNPRGDVLSQLAELNRQGHLATEAVLDQLIAMLMAAHDTNAVALYWAIALLAANPAWAERVGEEADHHLGEGEPASDDIDRLPVAEAVILESLRLYPPAARQFRIASTDVSLGDQQFTSGDAVFVSHVALHRKSDVFTEPDTFAPDRWLRHPDPPAHGFIPFGAGRHRCLGRHYAMHELITLLAMITRDFTITFPHGVDLQAELAIALRPATSARVLVSRRLR